MSEQPCQNLNAQLSNDVAGDANALPQHEDGEQGQEHRPARRFFRFTASPGCMLSLFLHVVIVGALLLLTLPKRSQPVVELLSAPDDELIEPVDRLKLDADAATKFGDGDLMEAAAAQDSMAELKDALNRIVDVGGDIDSTTINDPLDWPGFPRARRVQPSRIRQIPGSGRNEAAVAYSLRWIAAHQLPDGCWRFDHTIGPGRHRDSPNPGTFKYARNAATALALLPFLGAGQTHLEGEFKSLVKAGLNYLIFNERPKNDGGSFEEPGANMYAQGLAAIALCEAYALTEDTQLFKPARAAIEYIVYAQDPLGGGWGHDARQTGETSVTVWQLVALRSAQMTPLHVPPATIEKAGEFLDSVQTQDGACYGNNGPGCGKATNAAGLLCRLYFQWPRNQPSLKQGTAYFAARGPSTGPQADMFYNYFATQVLAHAAAGSMDNPQWADWKKKMVEFLSKEQATEGNAAGSWHFDNAWSSPGGRLYDTALATMVLEVYYQHMPLYKTKAVERDSEEWRLD